MASNLILEVPPYGSEGFRLSDNDEVDGGARRVKEDGGDQSLEIIGQLCLISHLQQLSSDKSIFRVTNHVATLPIQNPNYLELHRDFVFFPLGWNFSFGMIILKAITEWNYEGDYRIFVLE